jgi:hypothetical protein
MQNQFQFIFLNKNFKFSVYLGNWYVPLKQLISLSFNASFQWLGIIFGLAQQGDVTESEA